jgi:hypothetical protein
MALSVTYKMKSEVWLYPGMAGWHFISIPKRKSEEIKKRFHTNVKGWGSIPVEVLLGKTQWKTSIFPDKKSGSYLLPLKSEVRRKEKVMVGDIVSFSISIKN